MRVGLFVPCYVDQLAPAVAEATVTVLERAGCTVEYDPDQSCCGQPFSNLGLTAEAARLARAHLERFARYDAVVSPSASCVATVRRHYAALGAGNDPAGRRVRARTFELTEFLVRELGVTELGARFPHRVALLATCHGLRELGLGTPSEAVRHASEPRFPRSEPQASGERGAEGALQIARSEPQASGAFTGTSGHEAKRNERSQRARFPRSEPQASGAFTRTSGHEAQRNERSQRARFPRSEPQASGEGGAEGAIQMGPTERLLRSVAGLEFVTPSRDECCGFGGAFSVELPEVSGRIGRARLRDLAATGADYVAATDASCLFHLDGIRRREGTGPQMIHVAEILAAT